MTVDRVPSAECALVEQTRGLAYLLNIDHVHGGSKAKFFLARGFSPGAWQEFAAAVVAHAANNPATRVTPTKWGMRYRGDCSFPTPDGTNPCIRTVWEIAPDSRCPRLLTAHPR